MWYINEQWGLSCTIHILIGWQSGSYLQRLDPTTSLLKASWASLTIESKHSEIMRSLSTNFTRHIAHVHTTSRMIAPLRRLFEAGCRGLGKRLERTKQGLVWLAIISVQRKYAQMLCLLFSQPSPKLDLCKSKFWDRVGDWNFLVFISRRSPRLEFSESQFQYQDWPLNFLSITFETLSEIGII